MIAISVARKPLIGTVAANAIQWGTGGLNVDGCRIPIGESEQALLKVDTKLDVPSGLIPFRGPREPSISAARVQKNIDFGRWPANLILSQVALPDKSERYFYQTETP